jgi:hypothetical protein
MVRFLVFGVGFNSVTKNIVRFDSRQYLIQKNLKINPAANKPVNASGGSRGLRFNAWVRRPVSLVVSLFASADSAGSL